jgi:hypothetical protein
MQDLKVGDQVGMQVDASGLGIDAELVADRLSTGSVSVMEPLTGEVKHRQSPHGGHFRVSVMGCVTGHLGPEEQWEQRWTPLKVSDTDDDEAEQRGDGIARAGPKLKIWGGNPLSGLCPFFQPEGLGTVGSTAEVTA